MPVLKKVKNDDRKLVCETNTIFSCAISPKTKNIVIQKAKNRYRSASLTTEAALVFPVFFFCMYMLWQLFLFLLFQMQVGYSMTDTAMRYAHLGYPERKAKEENVDISWLYQPILWNALPESERAENIWVLCIPKEEGELEITVGYHFVCESMFFAKVSFPVQQSFRFYPYIGKCDEDMFVTEQEKDIVYVTEKGTVYHESKACSYLNIEVRSVATSQVDKERNSSGKKYSLCERCDDREQRDVVYLSEGGSKYHLVASCPALKRTVTEKVRAEVNGMRACHKCGMKE